MIDGNFVLIFLSKCEGNDSHVFVVNLRLEELATCPKLRRKSSVFTLLNYNVPQLSIINYLYRLDYGVYLI